MLTILIKCSYKLLPLSVNTNQIWNTVGFGTQSDLENCSQSDLTPYWNIFNSYERQDIFFLRNVSFVSGSKNVAMTLCNLFV